MKPAAPEPFPQLALKLPHAASAIDVSLPTFRRHVLPSLKVVRLNGTVVVYVDELRRWLSEHQEPAA